jgi:hypothetical protein
MSDIELTEGADPILIYEAATNEEAEVVRITLEAAGIPAVLQFASNNPVFGAVDDRLGDVWMNGVYVPAGYAEAARAILNAPPVSDEDLAEEAEAAAGTLEGV